MPERVSLPAEAVLVFRWREPAALLRALDAGSSSAGFESSWQSWLSELGVPVDAAAPVEGMVVFDRTLDPPALSWVLSFPLQEHVAARADAQAARAVPASAPPSGLGAASTWSCEAAEALGVARRRLVCAASRVELGRWLPAAARALPLVALRDSAFTLSVSSAPLAELEPAELKRLVVGLERSLWPIEPMNERFAAQIGALHDALGGELSALAADLDGAVLELSASVGEPALALRLTTEPLPSRSRLLQLMQGSGAVGIVPNALWESHRASRRAAFWWSFRPEPLAELREPLGALLATVLDFRGVPLRLQIQARSLVENFPLPRAPLSFAQGQRQEPFGPGGAGSEPLEPEEDWWLCQMEGELPLFRRYVSELVRAFDDPILGTQLTRLARTFFGERWAPSVLRQRAPKHRGLPHESFVLELEFKPSALASAVPELQAAEALAQAASFKRYLVFVPADPEAPRDGGLKLAWGSDEAFLTTLLASGRAGLKRTDTLAARAGLAGLAQQRALAGGFSSLEALLAALEPAGERPGPANAGPRWWAAPHRALGPIVYTVSPNGDAGGFVIEARLGVDTLEDVKFLVTAPSADAPR